MLTTVLCVVFSYRGREGVDELDGGELDDLQSKASFPHQPAQAQVCICVPASFRGNDSNIDGSISTAVGWLNLTAIILWGDHSK